MNLCRFSMAILLFSFTIFWKLISGSYIGDVAINCGYLGKTTALDGRQWFGDMDSSSDKSMFQPRGHSRTSIPDQKSLSADPVPYMTARASATQFYYSFQVNPGQKFIRLHFYPSSSYQGFENSLDFFTVKAGPFTLLRNFSASLAADAMGVNYIIKEFCVNEEESEFLNLTFTPTKSAKGKNYHAYVNGIEIITMPTGLYFTPDDDLGARVVGQSNRYFHIDNSTALETVQRLNIGGSSISPVEDFGMFRRWNADSNYLLGSELQPVNHMVPWTSTGLYTFSAPPRIFHTSWQTAEDRRTDNAYYNFTWKIPVDLGFGYLARFHFCDFALMEREGKRIKVNVLIDNQVAENVADVIRLSGRNGVPIHRDYMVMVKGDEVDRYDLFVALQSSDELAIELLRGLEIFKLSNPDNNLASKNEIYLKQVSAASWNIKIKHFLSAFDKKNTFVTGITILLVLLNLIVSKLRQNWEESTCHEEEDSQSASRKLSCRKFSLAEIILATQNFSNAFLIGKGGFGYVYKGLIRGGSKTVAIKRLKSNSKQGAREFWTEIETLSSIRHKHLVPLIGYCNEYREMILVYKYMPGGTLADNLYGIGRNGEDATYLTWEQRLSICIAAARGLDYLHTGIEYEIIHRDVKDSNILLDKNFVAKISDFGLSKLRNVSESQGNLTTKVKGTPGFVDPDYFMTHKPTTKTDVYAFGVVMLVVLCGRPAIDRSIPWEPRSLLSFFQEHTRKGDVNGIVDPSMRGKISTQSMNEFIKSLENCLHIEPRERPTMSEVATSLEWALEMQQSTMSCNPKQVVRFRSLEKPKEDEFCLELSKQNNYYEVVESVARHLSVDDPSKIRLTSHNCYSQQPKPQPIKYRSVEHLSDMLVHDNQTSDILYYETLDVPLPELQGLKSLKVVFHHATKDEIITHTIRLPKQSTVGDVLADLKTKVELSHPNAELRLLEIFYHKIYKIFPLKEEIENVNDQYWTLRAEEIPEEEKNLGPHDRLIHVYHFMKDTTQNRVVQNFGEPFHLVIRERETLAEVKLRIQKKLLVPDKEFSKWKFAFVTLGRPKYLQDSDIVSSRFQRRDVYGAWEQYLGLEHSDNAPKSSYATNQN